LDEIIAEYGDGSLFASGLIVDGLHYFNDNLWAACDSVINKNIPLTGNREQVLLKKYWVDRAKRFAKNYFKGDLKKMVYCLKDVHLLHKWHSINKQFKEVDFTKVLPTPTYKDISNFAAMSCSGGSCEITYI
jgi:ribonucleoside-diphosphate reductase alpha chain